MAYTVNFGKTPSGLLLPDGFFNVELYQIEERWSAQTSIRMYFMSLKIEAPSAFANRFHDENMLLGKRPWNRTPQPDRKPDPEYDAYCAMDDPEGIDPTSWRYGRGFRLFQDINLVLGLPMEGDVDMDQRLIMLNTGNHRFGVELKQNTGSDGRTRTEIQQVFKLGEQEPRIAGSAARQQGSPAAQARNNATANAAGGNVVTLPAGDVTERRRDRATATATD